MSGRAAHRTALVVDGHRGSAVAAVRSLGRGGWRVLAPAGTPAAASRHASAAVPIPDASRAPERFVASLERAVEDGAAVDLLVPSTDASLGLIHERCRFEGRPPAVLGGDRESAALALNKACTLAAADRAGFPTPAWSAPATAAEAHEAAAAVGYPCVVKPVSSYTLRDRFYHRRHRVVRDASELPPALADLAGADGTLPLVQQLVEGRSMAVTAVMRGRRALAVAARETLSFDPIEGGTSVHKRTVALDASGVAAALDLLRAIEFEGLAEVEYQLGPDLVPRLMEINPRLHGWVSLAVAAGVDLPLVGACAAVGDPTPRPRRYRRGVEMRWPAGEVRRIRRLLSPKPHLPPGTSQTAELRKAWPPWRPGMRFDGLDLSDPRPALARILR